jgi:aryl-alcohol dehydrogenase-like predicted oxidoreductase
MAYSERIKFGKTGLEVSRIGIGSSYGIGASGIEEAFEKGINFFYFGTLRTREMATAIQNLARTHRNELLVAVQSYSRVPWVLPRSVDLALRKLKLDYADFLILGKLDHIPKTAFVDELAKLKESGKVRFLIVSAHKRRVFKDHLRSGIFDAIMVRYNAAHTGAEKDVFPFLPTEGRSGVISYTATRWGTLLQPVVGEKTATASDCYRFVLRNPSVDVCFSGPKNRAELQEALKVLHSPPMSDEESQWMRRIGATVYKKQAHNFLLRKLIFD